MGCGNWVKSAVAIAAAALLAGCAADGEFRSAGDPNGPSSQVALSQEAEETASLGSGAVDGASEEAAAVETGAVDAAGPRPVTIVGSAVFLPFPQSAFKPALMEQVASELGSRRLDLMATGNGDGLTALCGAEGQNPFAELALTTREASPAEAAACVDQGRTLQVKQLATHTGALGPRVTGAYVAYDAEALRPEARAVLEHLMANRARLLSSPVYAAFFELIDGGV